MLEDELMIFFVEQFMCLCGGHGWIKWKERNSEAIKQLHSSEATFGNSNTVDTIDDTTKWCQWVQRKEVQ